MPTQGMYSPIILAVISSSPGTESTQKQSYNLPLLPLFLLLKLDQIE